MARTWGSVTWLSSTKSRKSSGKKSSSVIGADPKDKMDRAIGEIRKELEERVAYFTEQEKFVEAQRIRQRTEYDMEMMAELGYCSGIENYSRVISNRPVGSAPMTLLDFFLSLIHI